MRLQYVGPFVFALCCGCGAPTTTAPTANSSPELDRLKGAWRVVAIEAAGTPVPPDRVRTINLQYVFEGDKLIVRRPDRPDNPTTFSIDPTANPKRMTMNLGQATRAIYAVEGTRLRICIMVDENPGAGYPTEFASRASPKTDLLTMELASPAAPPPGGQQSPAAQVPMVQAPPLLPVNLEFTYSQSTGKLMLNNELVGVGYSGSGAAKNDRAKQADKDGPIPVGLYMFAGYRDDPKVGGKIMGLLPMAGENHFNRFPRETFAIVAQADQMPPGCFIVVPRGVLEKLSATPHSKVRVID